MNPPAWLPDERVLLVGEVMLRHPKTLPEDATIADAATSLDNDHVHLVLLTRGTQLVGTLTRADLPEEVPSSSSAREAAGSALPWAVLEGRTVPPSATVDAVQELLLTQGVRRLAVVADDGSLLGLVCLKRRSTGFCSDAGVEARATSRGDATDHDVSSAGAQPIASRHPVRGTRRG